MRGLVNPAWWWSAAAMAVAGIVLLVVGDAALDVIGFVLLGLGAIVATGAAFYAVGRSEDVERESRSR